MARYPRAILKGRDGTLSPKRAHLMKTYKAPRPFKARHPWRGSGVDIIVLAGLAAVTVYAAWGVLGAISRLP